VYALARRRRARARTPARADRELGARSAYAPANGSSQPDEMLEYFAAMPAESAGTRAARLPDSPGRGSAVADTRPGAASGARLPRTPMTWEHAPRNPVQVSGAPPWEPAPQPGSDLPWAARPAPAPAVRPPAPAAGSGATTPGSPPVPTAYPPAWDGAKSSDPAAGEPAWDPFAGISGEPAASWRERADDAPEPARAQPGGPADENATAGQNRTAGQNATAGGSRTAGQSATADENGTAGEGGTADQNDEPDARPIYVWNPSASTESFPIVPRDG
jgi:hypothetical protein